MKIAIPLCRQRIAPLFEAAETFLLFSRGQPGDAPTIWRAGNLQFGNKSRQLCDAGVTVLLCGAVSRKCQDLLGQEGIEVHPFLAGDVHEVLDTYLHDGPSGLHRYAMPGRCGGGLRARRTYRRLLSRDLLSEE